MDWKSLALGKIDDNLAPAPLRLLIAILENAEPVPGASLIYMARKELVLASLLVAEGSATDSDNLRARVLRVNAAAKQAGKAQPDRTAPFTLKSQKIQFEVTLSQSFFKEAETASQQASTESILAEGAAADSNLDPADFEKPAVQRPHFQIFMSHAHEDQQVEDIVKAFANKLKLKLGNLPPRYKGRFTLSLWLDHFDMGGFCEFEAQTDPACETSALAIYMLSDRWHNSAACQREHGHFLAKARSERDRRFTQVQLSGTFDSKTPVHGALPCYPRMWDQAYPNLLMVWEAGIAAQDAFCEHLRDRICDYIVKNLLDPLPPTDGLAPATSLSSKVLGPRLKRDTADAGPEKVSISNILSESSASDLAAPEDAVPPHAARSEGGDDREDALNLLFDWASAPESRNRMFALLGSFGSGKTTTSQLLVRKLLKAREANPSQPIPVPIYLDLRRATQFYGPDQQGKSAAELIRLSLHPDIREKITADDLRSFIREKPCLIIFDGLDEIGNRIGPEALGALWREMLEIVPTDAWTADRKAKAADWTKCTTRILVTCRTHFFRDHIEQQSFIYERDRLHGLERRDDYEPVQTRYMAAFTPEEIRSLFHRQLGDEAGEAAYQSIGTIPDLVGLASKPIMARYIAELSPNLIADRDAGKIINAAAIYHHLFGRALARDGDKRPILNPRDRQKMLEALAEHLWQLGLPEIEVDALDDWFDGYAERTPGVRISAQSAPLARGLLHTELRNASLLIRLGERKFRFVHTSFFEYFLARRILARLIDGSLGEQTSLPRVSPETKRFIIDLVRYDRRELEFSSAIDQSLANGQPIELRRLALALHFSARTNGVDHALPEGADLSALELIDWEWRDETLREVDFSGSNLLKARFTNIRFDGCRFEGTNIWSVVFDDCSFTGCSGAAIGSASARLRGGACDAASEAAFVGSIVHRDKSDHAKADLSRLPPAIRAAINSSARNFACFSPDGRSFVTYSFDSIARLWDAESGVELRRFEGHEGVVRSASFSPDGRSILTGSFDGTVRLWDAKSGVELRRLEGHERVVRSASFSPDGRSIVTGSYDNTARLWERESGVECRRFEGHEESVMSASFSPDGRSILTGSDDKTARLWDAESGVELRRFEGHEGVVRSASFSPDGHSILTGSSDHTARLWDAASGEERRRLVGHNGTVNSASFSPDGRSIITGSDDHTARLWDAESGDERRCFEGHEEAVGSASFSPDGRSILTGSDDKTARLWDVESGKERRRFEGHEASVVSASFSPDGHSILTGSDDNIARLWDAVRGVECRRLESHQESIWSANFSPDGRSILTGSYDKTARLWDGASGKERRRFEGHEAPVVSASFSPDGHSILTGAFDHTARLWDAESGEERRRFEGHEGMVMSTSFSPDGRSIITGSSDHTARLWDAESGEERRRFKGHKDWIMSASFRPDGRSILTGSFDGTVRLWDAKSGVERRCFEGHQGAVLSASFSPDGRSILTGSSDHTARLWDAESGRERRRFEGHERLVMSASFSPDGRSITTGSSDGTTRLWDAASGALLRTIMPLPRGWVHLSPEGWVIDYAPEAWEYLHGVELLPDGGRRIVNLWDHVGAV